MFERNIKRGQVTLFFCIAVIILMVNNITFAAQAKGIFVNPDFAFPRTVEKEAASHFKSSLKSMNGIEALRAAIQIDIAQCLISPDSFDVARDNFEVISDKFPSPYSDMAKVLQAELFRQYYLSNKWNFDKRDLSPVSSSSNPAEWNKHNFEDKIYSLLAKVNKNLIQLSEYPIADIKELLVNSEDAQKVKFTIADFLIIKASDILGSFIVPAQISSLPFGNIRKLSTPDLSQLRNDMIEYAIESRKSDVDKLAFSVFLNIKSSYLSGSDKTKFIEKCVEQLDSTPYCASFLSEYVANIAGHEKNKELVNENILRRKQYQIIEDYLKKFPDAYNAEALDSKINSLLSASVSCKFENRYLPNNSIAVDVSGANIYSFYLLVYKLPVDREDRNINYGNLEQIGRKISAIPVNINGAKPDKFSQTIEIQGLEPGRYAIVPSSNNSAKGIMVKSVNTSVASFIVSDIATFTQKVRNENSTRLYVVSANNQKPLAGAKVTIYPIVRGKRGQGTVKSTDLNGCLIISEKNCYYEAVVDNNYAFGTIYNYNSSYQENERLSANILTDLSIYKPSQDVGFAGVLYYASEHEMRLAPNRKILAYLKNPNYQTVDSLMLKSDNDGRVSGSFTIPSTGLLGSYRIELRNGKNYLADAGFEVAEYKAPSFMVEINSPDGESTSSDSIVWKGLAKTYSGMPVASGKVTYTITFNPLWWRMRQASYDNYNGECVTNSTGEFIINLPINKDLLKNFEYGYFLISVSVTDQAGETQQSDPKRFALSENYRLSASLPQFFDASTSEVLDSKIKVMNNMGDAVKKEVTYIVKDDSDNVVGEGKFISPDFKISIANLKSGKYKFKFSLSETQDGVPESVTDSLVVYRDNDIKVPVKALIWLPKREYIAANNDGIVNINIGTSLSDRWVLASLFNSKGLVKNEWLNISDGIIAYSVPTPPSNERLFVTFTAMNNLKAESVQAVVIPMNQTTSVKIKSESFRNNINPGSQEEWRFKFELNGSPLANIPVMAVMSNKALNALAPFSWHLNPYGSLSWSPSGYVNSAEIYSTSNSAYISNVFKPRKYNQFVYPEWQTYGYPLYGFSEGLGSIRIRGARSYASYKSAKDSGGHEVELYDAVAAKSPETVSETKMENAAVTTGSMVNETDPTSSIPLRKIDMSLAFFKPFLLTDDNGVATIRFNSPQFVGTWQFQIAGYTPELKGGVAIYDVVSSKPVMAQINAPRFVRTGDLLNISATLYNNSSDSIPVSGRMEFMDLLSGKILKSVQFESEILAGAGSRVVASTINIPDNISQIAIRVYAISDTHSDGEQAVVEVLPSSSPLRESETFYLDISQNSISVSLPEFEKNADVMLKYCSNPIWECVAALPSLIEEKSVNTLANVNALYGNAMASYLFSKYPALAAGIEAMAKDSTLVSALQTNSDIKDFVLNNTPWVNDAANETLRMVSLLKYADASNANTLIAKEIRDLVASQNLDGGWSWCPGMQSSRFVTERVIANLASLKSSEALPEGLSSSISRAVRYVDSDLVNTRKKYGKNGIRVIEVLNYLNDRNSLGKYDKSEGFGNLEKEVIKLVAKDWKRFGVREKSIAALVLQRSGYSNISHMILESLRQYASYSPERGMWYGNIESYAGNDNAIQVTSSVLDAFYQLSPSSPEIDKMRQFLVVSKQAQNWGDNQATCNVISTLLRTGSNWIANNDIPELYLGGKRIIPNNVASMSGAFSVSLPIEEASGKDLIVSRTCNQPAWGAVISQYVAPIVDVKAQGSKQLRIEKKLLDVSGKGEVSEELHVGDKVKVTLTISTDRDLEYVAVSDARSGCLEPDNQLSGFTGCDGLRYYIEVRDDVTNIFLDYLPKGTYVISYDCHVDRVGEYTLGITSAQSQYAPEISAHSAGSVIRIK